MKLSITLIGLLILSCGIILFLVLGRGRGSDTLNTPNALAPKTEDTVRNAKTQQHILPKQSSIQNIDGPISNDADDFYRVIIENNIFRPLNWKPTQQEPAWTLLGTAITADNSTTTAYISERKTNQFYAVKVGEKIGNTVVTTILPKQVTLDTGGKTLNLYMASTPFLSRTGSNRSSSYRPPQPQVISKSSTSQPRTTKDKERQAWRDAQKERIAELKKMAEKLRATSEKERRKMHEHLEQRASGNVR